MDEASITKGYRHVSFPRLPDVPVDPPPVPLAPLDMVLRFSEGRHFSVHLAKEPCSALTRELLMALVELSHFGGTLNSPGRAEAYTTGIRKFVRYLSTQLGLQKSTLTVSDLTTQELDSFEEHLRAQAPHKGSVSPSSWMGTIVRLLRWWDETHPERVSEALRARLAYVANGPAGRSTPRDGYSGQITDALRASCLKDISQVTERLTTQCDQLLARGHDPEVSGWQNTQNVVWYIAQHGVIPAHTIARKRWYQVSGGLEEVHARVFPTARDLVPFLVLLALSTDIAIESLKELRTDCLQNPAKGTVEIRYLKRRAHPQEWKTERVRDGGITTPGGIIRLLLRLTQHARIHLATTRLWIAFGHGRLYEPHFPGKIVDRGWIRATLLHPGRTLYPGLLNDCFFDPAVAHCLKAVKNETPLIAQCTPSRCPNSCITERHLPAWEQAIASAKEHLSQRRLPVLQRTIIEQQIADFSRVIAPLKGGNDGGEPDNRAEAPRRDGPSV